MRRQRDRQTDRQRQAETDRDRQRQRETERQRDRETETHTQRDTHTERHTHIEPARGDLAFKRGGSGATGTEESNVKGAFCPLSMSSLEGTRGFQVKTQSYDLRPPAL